MNESARKKMLSRMQRWRKDWNLFCREVLRADLDDEQKAIIRAVQHNKRVAVSSGTSRGKDYVAACCALCFLYLTPVIRKGELLRNTKVALTAPTGRQVETVMMGEIGKLMQRTRGLLPGRVLANSIKTNYTEWFLVGFKSAENNTEAWSGFHAANTMFVVTEASGVADEIFNAIEGNLQGNSRLLIVFNPNITTGYAARAMKSERFAKFRLNSLNAANVLAKREIYTGQVDYEWVRDKVEHWCSMISAAEFDEGEGDFRWEGGLYRPNDLFRVKVLGMFPKVAEDILIPYEWIEIANRRWMEMDAEGFTPRMSCRLGSDVAGMGRDSSILCPRYGSWVERFIVHQSSGKADHMHVAGMHVEYLKKQGAMAFIDTIGEGAGVFSRLQELGFNNAYSCKFSESSGDNKDITGQYSFANMRAYCYWALRDWLNPKNGFGPALPPDDSLTEELTDTHWKFQSNGSIIIEKKDDIKARIGRSPDRADALANTFYPVFEQKVSDEEILADLL